MSRSTLRGSRRRRAFSVATGRSFVEQLEGRVLLAYPVIEAIANTNVPADKALIVPVRASDADGHALTYTVSSSSNDVEVVLHTGNPFLRLTVAGFGVMELQLFKDLAPNTVNAITGLVQSGFYDRLTFHRIMSTFMVQGGDPSGDGTGGPQYEFDDEFNADLIFSGYGQLAMANSGDDTNGSQFFITTSSPRWLDFNHTIFGQLVRGLDVLDAIRKVPVDATTSRPNTPVVITTAQLVQNKTDAVLTVRAKGTATGAVTVTASDGHGGQTSATFTATGVADTTTDPPYLNPVADVLTPLNTPVTLHLSATNIGGGTPHFSAQILGSTGATFSQPAPGSPDITVTPADGFAGPLQLYLGVYQNDQNDYDSQLITIGVGDQAISATGANATASARTAATLQVATFTDADPAGTSTEYSAEIRWADGSKSPGSIAPADAGGFAVTGAHTYPVPGNYVATVLIRGTAGATAQVQSTIVAAGVNVGQNVTIAEGSSLLAERSFVPAQGSTWTATADWGDGSAADNLDLTAEHRFTLNHQYRDNGTYTATVTVTDDLDGSMSDSLVVTVNSAPPSVTVAGDATGLRGQLRTISLAGTDPSPADADAGIAYLIDWKDGSPIQTLPAGAATATHTFTCIGQYQVTVTPLDKDALQGTTKVWPITITAAALQPDPTAAGKMSLIVVGITGNDQIRITPGKKWRVTVFLGSTSAGTFAPSGRIRVYGRAGNDSIIADPKLPWPVEFYGEDGKDTLTGGIKDDILVGGAGNDLLDGRAGRDVMIGSVGIDKLVAGDGEDLLIADWTAHETDVAALVSIMKEWSRADRTAAQRLAHLRGTARGGLNGAILLTRSTVRMDRYTDLLSGGAGADAFFFNTNKGIRDTVADWAKGDLAVDVN